MIKRFYHFRYLVATFALLVSFALNTLLKPGTFTEIFKT